MSDTNWPDLISALLAGNDLSAANTNWAMTQIMTEQATPAQIAGFAVALRAKGETAQEVSGLAEAMIDAAQPLEIAGPSLDIVGTGGDMAATVNISTMSAIVAAAAGARVIKHGNRASSSQCGSADVLAQLGVVIDLPASGVAKCVDEVGIGFAFAPVFHPAMRHAGPARRELGVPTVFNILGPLANPGRPTAQMVGCANLRLAPVMADVLAQRGTKALVVRGDDGLDEVTIFDNTSVWDATKSTGVVADSVDLHATGIDEGEARSLTGGTSELNAEIARALFRGDTSGPMAAVRDAVALNTAAALVTWDAANGVEQLGGVTERVSAALPRAFEAIDSGAAAPIAGPVGGRERAGGKIAPWFRSQTPALAGAARGAAT